MDVFSPTATGTATRIPTEIPTPVPLFLPGVAGFQPTPIYDPAQWATASPSTPPACPGVDPGLPLPAQLVGALADFPGGYPPPDLSNLVVSSLNQGGIPDTFLQTAHPADPEPALMQDLTNDGQPEILLKTGALSILGCDPGGSRGYTVMGQFMDDIDLVPPHILAIQDLNRDGFPELLLTSRAFGGFSTTDLLQICSWDGQEFSSVAVLHPTYPYYNLGDLDFLEIQGRLWGITYHAGSVNVLDDDRNGTVEFIINSGIPGHPDLIASGPWRRAQDVFTWNGEAYVLLHSDIDPPIYRFQALHDADQAALWGEYERALALYQDVIFSDLLLGWSPELYEQQAYSFFVDSTPTPFPVPAEEYYHLAAYARFRILVLHALHGYDRDGQIVFDTLVEKFPEGQPGHASVVLAEAFWPVYLATHDVGQACTQALQAVGDDAEDILYWLDGDFHGIQAPDYQRIDLCPFGQMK